MLDSPNYVASKEKGELVPMVTLNKFDNEEDEWTWWEKLHIIFKMFIGDEMGGYNFVLKQFLNSNLDVDREQQPRTLEDWIC